MVTSAYWTLVRKAQQRALGDPAAGEDVERLNRAYGTLSPDAKSYAQRPQSPQEAVIEGTGVPLVDGFADFVTREAMRTRERWANRNPEVAILGGVTLVLMLFAFAAGAHVGAVFLCVGIIALTIWAPWRRIEP
jgi:hypothetical protein